MKPISDKVLIRDLKVQAVIGAFDWEREITQELIFNIDLEVDLGKASKSDNLADVSVDYGEVAQYVKAFVEKGQFHLLEALVEGLADGIYENFGVASVRVRVLKPRPGDGFTAGIEIVRSFDS